MRLLWLQTIVWLSLASRIAWAAPPASNDSYAKVQSVLAARCYACHSADSKSLMGGLRLDSREGMLKGGEHGPAIAPGHPETSRLVKAIGYADKSLQMPPSGKLPDAEIALLTDWIKAGAPVPAGQERTASQGYWAFQPLKPVALPPVKNAAWCRTPLDRFILARLEAKGLKPNPPADRRTLLRRVTFDLIGLPPSPADMDAFLADKSPNAYEKVIDRLLASPRYGERWGRHWLDVAHYADTHGYDKDKRRDHAWPYRDYVIRAFNQDKPYARFIKEQIAGDVLYPYDADGVIATGFLAAGPWDFVGQVELAEGTVEKEKTRLLDRDDMVATTISTFDSLTVHCARCHNHKFDPIPQQDYYRLQAVFAGIDRGDRPYAQGTLIQQRDTLEKRQRELASRRASLLRQIDSLHSPALARLDAELKRARTAQDALPPPNSAESPANGYHSAISATPDAVKWVQIDLGQSVPIDSIRLIPARPTDFADTPGFGFPVRFRVAVAEDAAFTRPVVIADHAAADFANPGDNPVVFPAAGVRARYVRVTANRLWQRTNDYVFALAEMQVVSGGANIALGKTVTALDSIEEGRWSVKYLVDGFDSRHRLADPSDPQAAKLLAQRAQLLAQIQRAEEERAALLATLVDAGTWAELGRTELALAEASRRLQALPTPELVYAVLPRAPRPIHVLARGDVEQPREAVGAGALSCVPGLNPVFNLPDPQNEGERRAALAEWIASPKNMLTWRSIVNRVWHYHFGRGIVETPNDFGRNGSRPTHPELLDWLARSFLENGQSFKKLHRLILLSATYRQSSANHPDFARIDGDNRLLWRMNRQRLDAEEIRDSVLAVSGQLNLTMGGPGYALFRFKDDHSPIYDYADLTKLNTPAACRRAVYQFIVRSVENPFLECLDCADPNINTPVRNTTITALQALALLNDSFMLQQAERFAQRLQKTSSDPRRQIETAFALAFGRPPAVAERADLTAYARKFGLVNACRLLLNANEFVFID